MTDQPPTPERMYLVSERELDQIKNDCAYPETESCIGCPLADGKDNTRASGLGCKFIGANALMEEVLSRPAQQPQPVLKSPNGWCLPTCDFFGDCNSEDIRACKRDAKKHKAQQPQPVLTEHDMTYAYEQGLRDGETMAQKAAQQPPDALAELERWVHKNSMKVRAELVDMVYSYKLLQEIARLRSDPK